MPMWIAPPHFFKSGRLIVLYIGEEPRLLQGLAHILGPQFAGNRGLLRIATCDSRFLSPEVWRIDFF